LADELNPNLNGYKLDSSKRLMHFFAQVLQEVGPTFRLAEHLDYSAISLERTFGYFRRHPEDAEMYGRTDTHAANQREIANRAYNGTTGNRGLGNGDITSADGWNFRGRGLKQTTGRHNYTEFSKGYALIWADETVNFVNNPDLLEQMHYAVRAGVFFWLQEKLYNLADTTTDANQDVIVDSITKIINKNTDSYADRRNNYKRFKQSKIFDGIEHE
jgi:predicted chitinase